MPDPGGLLRRLGPLARPFLHRYWILSRGMTLGVRCAAFTSKNEVCLVRHTYVDGWFLPGGGVDPGETIYAAGERELLEETGIILEGPAELFAVYANTKASRRDHVALLVCRHWHQGAHRQPDLEIAEVGIFPLDGLPVETTSSTRSRLAELRGDGPPPQHW